MSKITLKIIAILLGMLALKTAIDEFSIKPDRSVVAFCEGFSFEKELSISETFTTDFDSYYTISYSLANPRPYEHKDSLQPIQTHIEILYKNKPVEIFEDQSFFTETDAEYQLNLKFVNANSKPNTFNICIQADVPGPSYSLLFEREFKWLSWVIIGSILLIAIVTGYFGFRK